MQNFSYHRPAALAEALALKAREPDARFLAGGTDLFLAMEHGPAPVETVIDLKGIEGLAEIRALPEGGFALGALTLMADIESHPGLRAHFPALCDAAAVVGGPPIRNRATLGGNLCNASPAADTSTPLLALAAEAVVASPDGERTIPLAALWAGPRRSALAPGEILTEVRLPALAPRSGVAFERLTRSAMDIAIVNVAARLTLDGAGKIAEVSCALGSVGPTVLEVAGLGEALRGRPCDDKALEAARELAEKAAQPIDDHRASAAYRREMAGLLALRALKRAGALAAGGAS